MQYHTPSHPHTLTPPGNMFSTLRGQRFDWMLLADEEATPTQQQLEPEAILNFIPFEDSTYSTDPIIGLMESQVCGWVGTSLALVCH